MILYKYILRNHALPFIFSVITLLCIFLLNFLMKFADRLVGKGLDTLIVIQLIVYSLAWMVVLVVPMATLVATLMAFGTMSQNNEITIIKSSGISLYKMMLPVIVVSIIIGYLLILFNNDVLPDANHKVKLLMQDISRTKPTLSLEPGVFSQEVSNYAILVRETDPHSNRLTDVTIYDYTDPRKINVVTAKRGRIYFSKDQEKLLMDLEDGEIHETNAAETNLYRKVEFKKHRIAMDAEQFSFQQSTPGGSRSDRELSVNAMMTIVDSLREIRRNYDSVLVSSTAQYLYADSFYNYTTSAAKPSRERLVYTRVADKIQTAKNVVLSNFKRVEFVQNEINKYLVEVHKKYALPAACLVFVLIGAPLGTMVKKGGFGVAASISLFFFLVYWAFLIGGEKLADRNFASPFIVMWAANIIIGFAGVLLTIKTVRETVQLKFTAIKKIIPENWMQDNEETEEEE